MQRGLATLGLMLSLTAPAAGEYLIIRATFGQPPAGTTQAATLVEIVKFGQINRVRTVDTRLGRNTQLFDDQQAVRIVLDRRGRFWTDIPTITREYQPKQAALKQNPAPAALFETAEWTLQRGLGSSHAPGAGSMLKEFQTLMDQLAGHDGQLPADAQRAVVACKKLKEGLNQPLPRDTALVDRWTGEGRYQAQDMGAHYTVLFKGDLQAPPELARRVSGLEQVFEGFYSWFALKGQVLPLPAKRLVLVVDPPREFRERHAALQAAPLIVDGFLVRRDQVAFYSREPLEDGCQALKKSLQPGANPLPVAKAQTLGLLQRALEEESEVLAATHVGVEQLIGASGLLPRTVTAPQWLQFGMPAVFAASRGAPWAGFGGPSWDYLPDFKRLALAETDSPATVLRKLLADDYFHQAAAAQGDPVARRRAQMLAWSLSYYLAQRDLPGLLRFYQVLAQLPRELELDGEVLVKAFAQAFDLMDATRPDRINEEKFGRLAADWFQRVGRFTVLPIPENDWQEIRKGLNE